MCDHIYSSFINAASGFFHVFLYLYSSSFILRVITYSNELKKMDENNMIMWPLVYPTYEVVIITVKQYK